jgi:tetrahydromethanopterin S-methyltransferase subunit E
MGRILSFIEIWLCTLHNSSKRISAYYIAFVARIIISQVLSIIINFNSSEDAVRSSTSPMTKSSIEMENHVFQKAKTRVSL